MRRNSMAAAKQYQLKTERKRAESGGGGVGGEKRDGGRNSVIAKKTLRRSGVAARYQRSYVILSSRKLVLCGW